MRLISFFIAIILYCFLPVSVCAQYTAQQEKQIAKEAKKEAKKLKSEKWQVYGNAQSIDIAIKNYYLKLEEGFSQPLICEAMADNEHNALQKAQHRANAQYAAQHETYVLRDININVSNKVTDEVNSSSEFAQTVQTKVNQQIKSLRPELTLTRKNDDGKVEVKMFFLISKD